MAVQHSTWFITFAVLSVFSSLIQVSFFPSLPTTAISNLFHSFLSFYSISSSLSAEMAPFCFTGNIKPKDGRLPFLPTDKCVSTLFSFLLYFSSLISIVSSSFSRGFVPCIFSQIVSHCLFVVLFPTAYKLVQNLPRNSILTVFLDYKPNLVSLHKLLERLVFNYFLCFFTSHLLPVNSNCSDK